MSEPKSGSQIGAENVARLETYLGAVTVSGRGLPSRGGKVNMSAVALACGFDRNVLYTNPAAERALKEALDRVGLELPGQDTRRQPDQSLATPDQRDRRILQLEQANASLKAENGGLRTERNGLRERLRRFEHIEAHMIETGRRVAT